MKILHFTQLCPASAQWVSTGLLGMFVWLSAADAFADATAAPSPLPATNGEATDAPAEAPPKPEVPAEMTTPKAALKAFIERMRADEKKEAAQLLDLSDFNTTAAESRGPDLAYKLYQVMQRSVRIPPEDDEAEEESPSPFDENQGQRQTSPYANVPDEPDFEGSWSLDKWTKYPGEEAKEIVISRGEKLRWRFSKETVVKIDALFATTEQDQVISIKPKGPGPTEPLDVTIRNLFPPLLHETAFLLPHYQWICLLLLIPVGRLVEVVTRATLTRGGDGLLRWLDHDFEETGESTHGVWRQVGRFAHAAFWYTAADKLKMPIEVVSILLIVLKFVTIVAAVLAYFSLIDLVSGFLIRRAQRRDRKSDELIIPLVSSTIKIATVVLSVVAILAAYDNELTTTLLGGLGIGGIAIALASQETLSNFFGSITLLFDRPFEVGDWVKIDTVEGEVESLGFRSTRIRTGLNSQVTLPNNKLAGASVDNLGRRKYRRYLGKLGLEYGTSPKRIEAFCEGIRELVRRHPHTRKDFYAAYFNDYGPSSLDILVVVYFKVPDWATELRERHRLLADIARLAESVGVSFAFPTQTLYVNRSEKNPALEDPDNPDDIGARAAAEIAGELLNYQDRPGKVKFSGPTNLS